MDTQNLFNLACGTALACLGWFARQLWEATQNLKEDLKKIEIELPTQYVRKVDIELRFDKLESILEKIFDRLDKKADK